MDSKEKGCDDDEANGNRFGDANDWLLAASGSSLRQRGMRKGAKMYGTANTAPELCPVIGSSSHDWGVSGLKGDHQTRLPGCPHS